MNFTTLLDGFDTYFSQIEPWLAYTILFLSAVIENVFPPVIGDTVTVLGAYLITTGQLKFWPVYLSVNAGSTVGFMIMYFIGRIFGRGFLKTERRQKIFGLNKLQKVEKWFADYGYLIILGNRFLSGTRSIISVFAGLFHLKWYTVLISSAVSALLWNGLLIYLGYLLGVNWRAITGIIRNYNTVILILTVVAIMIWLFRRYYSRKGRSHENSQG